jgi:hypothetical protein
MSLGSPINEIDFLVADGFFPVADGVLPSPTVARRPPDSGRPAEAWCASPAYTGRSVKNLATSGSVAVRTPHKPLPDEGDVTGLGHGLAPLVNRGIKLEAGSTRVSDWTTV